MKTTSRRGSASSQPLPRAELEARLDEARRIDAQLDLVARRERRATAELAYLLSHAERCEVHRSLGHARIGQYAVARGFVSSDRKARELIALARELERLPRLRVAFREGEVAWTKARTVARIATAETEAVWLERAQTRTSRQLEVLVAEAKGEPAPVRRTVKQTKQQAVWLEEALRLARQNSDRPLTDEEALRWCVGATPRPWPGGVAARGRPTGSSSASASAARRRRSRGATGRCRCRRPTRRRRRATPRCTTCARAPGG
ncbi:MAG: hypothetical protein M9894_39585 [Planctomycetes bacterium]|nr:hypothetical protein [Planctomycetota bacterium]